MLLEPLEFRGEPGGSIPTIAHVQGNHSKGIPSYEVFIFPRVVQDKSVHSIDKHFFEKFRAIFLVQMQEDFAVTICGEANLLPFALELSLELLPKLQVVIDLAVDRKSGVPLYVCDWLCPREEPIDGEPLVSEIAVAEAGDPIPVRPAVTEQLGEAK